MDLVPRHDLVQSSSTDTPNPFSYLRFTDRATTVVLHESLLVREGGGVGGHLNNGCRRTFGVPPVASTEGHLVRTSFTNSFFFLENEICIEILLFNKEKVDYVYINYKLYNRCRWEL